MALCIPDREWQAKSSTSTGRMRSKCSSKASNMAIAHDSTSDDYFVCSMHSRCINVVHSSDLEVLVQRATNPPYINRQVTDRCLVLWLTRNICISLIEA